jgi:hypothetical protein
VPEFPKKPWPVTLRQLMAQVGGVTTDHGGEAQLSADVISDEGRLVVRTIPATPAPPRSCSRRPTWGGSGWALRRGVRRRRKGLSVVGRLRTCNQHDGFGRPRRG